MFSPWDVNTEPTTNKQNVSLRYGVILKVDELPKLTSENSELDEVVELEWMKINSYNDIEKKNWAFNHDEIVIKYLMRNSLLNEF